MYYPDDKVEEVLRANNIVDVVGSYVHLQKKGANYFGLCPFHNEKSPSFSVSEPKQMFYCFGCGAGGNAATFLMKYENYSFQEALQTLADRAGVKLPEVNYSEEAKRKEEKRQILRAINKEAAIYYYKLLRSPKGRKGLQYLADRKLDPATMRDFGLGYADGAGNDLVAHLKHCGYADDMILEAGVAAYDEKRGMHDKFWNRVIFPIMDVRGQVIGFGGRVMGDAKPKYLNSPETEIFDKSRNLYGLHIAKRSKAPYKILCEGYMDVIAMHQAGFHEAVASLGTSFTEGQAALLKRYSKQVLLAYDNDGAGVRAALRNIGILKKAGIEGKVIDLSPCKDPDEFIKVNGKEAFLQRITNAENSFFYELRMMGREYAMSDPAQRTQFHHAIAAKLCEIEDEIERENYLAEAARRYYVDEGSLRRLVASYNRSGAAQTVWNNGAAPAGARRTEQQPAAPGRPAQPKAQSAKEERESRNEQLLLTWLADEPEIFDQVAQYVRPAHFTEGVHRNAAEGYWAILGKRDGGNPASVIGMFETEEEQEKAAALFQTRIRGIKDAREREKALRDIVIAIRKAAADRDRRRMEETMQEPTAEELSDMIRTRKELQDLQKVRFNLTDATSGE
ncbi:MAG: DNA primase [Lachnospiraceae bacterium]|nr:DNA primase [Lachnospiraceae bacterium]